MRRRRYSGKDDVGNFDVLYCVWVRETCYGSSEVGS